MATSKNWDSVAASYEEHVFNVFDSDVNQLLNKSIKHYSQGKKIAGDFGCGVGRALPLLSDRFDKVYAWDFSAKCVKLAAGYGFKNVQCKTINLAEPKIKLPKVDFALCVNVAISENMDTNYSIIRNVIHALAKKGLAILVLPSWESVSMVTWRALQVFQKQKKSRSEILEEYLEFYSGNIDPKNGIFTVDKVTTKHWLLSEMLTLFDKPSLIIEAIERIEYQWSTEIASPPKWLGDPKPWDWMVILRKR